MMNADQDSGNVGRVISGLTPFLSNPQEIISATAKIEPSIQPHEIGIASPEGTAARSNRRHYGIYLSVVSC